MLASLAILGDTGLELTGTTGDDEDSAVSLGGTSDHVLDEVTVTGSVCRTRMLVTHMFNSEVQACRGNAYQ